MIAVRTVAIALGLALSAFTPAAARAADALDAFAAPTTISDTLALDLLGEPDLKPTKPGSIDAALTDLRAFYKDRNLVPGMAVELTPWDMGMGASTRWKDYVDNPLTPIFARSSASLATASSGSGGGQLVYGAVGLRVRLWDGTDWRLSPSAIECARRTPPAPPPGAPPSVGISEGPALTAPETDHVKECLGLIAWNAPQAALGLGATTSSPGGAVDSTHFGTGTAWLSIGFPLGKSLLLLVSPRYTYQAHVPAPAGVNDTPRQHLYGAGAKLTFRWAYGTISLTGGAGGRTMSSTTDARGLIGLGAQFAVSNSAWIELGFSGALDPKAQGQFLGLSSLKWNFDVKPRT